MIILLPYKKTKNSVQFNSAVSTHHIQSARVFGMSEEKESKVVCVTGASGFIASWLVKLLLQRGYTVKATVRNPDDPKQTQHLLPLAGAEERLQLFKADLLIDGSFDSVMPGCHGVFHTASPCFVECSDPQAELIEPAVKGTLNVLRACVKVASVTRVVITSSIASVLFNGKRITSDVVVDETWYSDPVVCKDSKLWYPLSKTLAEQAAWVFAKQNRIDLVTLHPGMVIGPILQPTLNLSVEMILDLFNDTGKNTVSTYRLVDVRDVADAHITALENPAASGRYCLVERVEHVSETSKTLRRLYPMSKCKDDMPFEPMYQVSKERALSLGINFTPIEESLKETIESLKEKGFLTY